MLQLTLKNVDLTRLDQITRQIVLSFPTELVIGLVGTLGAGKTTFAQALAAAMGVDRDNVTSPTFTLLTGYDARVEAGPIKLYHLDAYRLADEDEFLELGVEEFFERPNTWTLIEWADRVKSVLPNDTLWVTMDLEADASTRRLSLETKQIGLNKEIQALASAIAP